MKRSNQQSTVLSPSASVKESSITAPGAREPLLKRPQDVIVSAFMIILSMPVSLPIALAIKRKLQEIVTGYT